MIVTKLGKVLAALRTEDGEADDCVANHDGAILDQHRVVDAHQEALLQDKADMRVESIETVVDVSLFPFVSIVESDLFRVSQQVAMEGAILTFESLLLSGQSAESRGDQTDNPA